MPPVITADAPKADKTAQTPTNGTPAPTQDAAPKTSAQQAAGNQAVQAAANPDPAAATPKPPDTPPDPSDFPITTLPGDEDLLVVPENAPRTAISQRLFGDETHETAFRFVVVGDVPAIRNEPGRAVRVLGFDALREDAKAGLRNGLEGALTRDVQKVINVLCQRWIRPDDEDVLAQVTLRWSNRNDLKDPQGTNYFDRYLNRLDATTLTEDRLFSDAKKTALEWLIDEAESTQDQVIKAIALRSNRKVDYTPTEDVTSEFPPATVIGRFYYSEGSEGKGSLQIKVMYKITEADDLDTALTATRNDPWTLLRAVVPHPDPSDPTRKIYRGYALDAPTLNDPLIPHAEDDPAGHYYWYFPGTVMVGVEQFEKNFAKGGLEERLQRRALLSHALQNIDLLRPDLLFGLDYDVLSTATVDERLMIIRAELPLAPVPGPASALIARVISSTPHSDRAELDAELRGSELLNQVIKIPDPAITAALGPTTTEEEEDNLDRLEGSEDLYKSYRAWLTHPFPSEGADDNFEALQAKAKQFGFATIQDFLKAISDFQDTFERFAVQVAFQMLDENEALAKGEFARYAGDTSTSGIADLRKELKPLADQVFARDSAIAANTAAEQRELETRPAGGVTEEHSMAADEVTRTRQIAEDQTKATDDMIAGMKLRFPVLADPKIDVTALLGADDQTLQDLLLGSSRDVLSSIEKARWDLKRTPSDVWLLEGVMARARTQFGIGEGSIFDLVLTAKEKDEKRWELIKGIFLAALAIGLTLTGNPAGLLVAAGISTYTAISHIQEYAFKKMMVGTAFDRAQALTADDPSFFWLALDIVGAIVDASAAAKALSTLKPLVKEALAITDAAKQAEKIKEIENVARSLDTAQHAEGAAKQTAKSADAIAPDAKAPVPHDAPAPAAAPQPVPNHAPPAPGSKAASAATEATEKSEDLAKKVVADVEARIKGEAALAKLGEEGDKLLQLCKGDAAAAGGLARLEPGARAAVVEALGDSKDAARLLGNLASQSDAVAETTEKMYQAFVVNAKRADQFEAILKKYFVTRGSRIRKANMFRALGEAGLEDADYAELAEKMKGFAATKNVQTEFSKRAIAKIADKLPPGSEGIQKITEMSAWMEASAKGSVFEQWCRKHIFSGMERFSEDAAKLTGKYSRTLLRSDGFLKEGEQLTVVELKNYVDTLPTFAKNTAEGRQLGNYAEMIKNGVKGPGGLPFGKVQYVFSTREAAEKASANIRLVLGEDAVIEFIDPLTGSRVLL